MKKHSKPLATVLAASAMMLSCAVGQAQDESAAKPSLYERLGGVYNIATVVDDFVERMLVNDIVNGNEAVAESRERVPKAGLKFQVTAMVCQATGGPEKYAGRSMLESHSKLNISETEWQAMADEFKKSLDKYGVPEKEQGELFAIVGTTKGDIVVSQE